MQLHQARTRLIADKTSRRTRSWSAARQLRVAEPVRGFIQWGTDFDLPAGTRYVTYDDQTIAQAQRSFRYAWIDELSPAEFSWLIARQRKVFLNAVACCTATEWAAQSLSEDYGVSEARIRVVGVGAARCLGPDLPVRDWHSPRFLFVGFDWSRKNGARVLRVFERLQTVCPAAHLDLVGGHPELDLPNVTGHGRLNQRDSRAMEALELLYSRATCLVLPSFHEPAGLSYVEAMNSGIGSIGTTSGGARTLLGESGVFVDPNSDDDLYAAMVLFADPLYAARMGEHAKKRSVLMNWQSTAARLVDALEGRPDACDLRLTNTP